MAIQTWDDEKLDKLAALVEQNTKNAEENSKMAKENLEAIKLQREESKEQSIRFAAYQQASQWVVNLAFGLLATATLTTIITAVFRR